MPRGDIYSAVGDEGGDRSKKRNSLASMQEENKKNKEALKATKQRIAAEKKGAEALEKWREKRRQQERKEEEKASKKLIKDERTAALNQRAEERKAMRAEMTERRKLQLEAMKESAREQLEAATTVGQKIRASFKVAGTALLGTTSEVAKAVTGALSGSVDKYLGTYTEYMTAIEARIQGAYNNVGYEELESVIRKNTSGSPYVKYTDVLSNLAELVDSGTAVNLTQRAFLATIKDSIATTFDALDSNLLRLIRLQQNDSTAARLGMEAELTKLFNYYFSDTSYLSEAFDSVTSALTDLSSQLNYSTSVEMEYVIQKWLGALGSAGADSSTLSNIATAINYLGTGQIDQISTEMQNLLVMAANRAGLSYSNMLANGVTTSQINQLLYSVIDYIQEVTSSANNVVKAQYAELFGLTVADITAFKNISDNTLNDLYDSAMTYTNTLTSLESQLNQVSGRMHLSTMMDNVIDNILAATGTGVAGNAGLYGTYKIADMIESITGGIQIPTIGVLGSFLGIENSIEELIKIGTVGFSAMGALFSALGNWSNGGGLNLSNWNSSFNKGSYGGFTSIDQLSVSPSSAGTVSNTNTTGMQQSVYDEQSKSAEEISGKEQTDESDSQMVQLLRYIKEYFEAGGSSEKPLIVTLQTPKVVAGTEDLSINGLLKSIKDRLVNMGTDENPVYVVNDVLYGNTGEYNITDKLVGMGLLNNYTI